MCQNIKKLTKSKNKTSVLYSIDGNLMSLVHNKNNKYKKEVVVAQKTFIKNRAPKFGCWKLLVLNAKTIHHISARWLYKL